MEAARNVLAQLIMEVKGPVGGNRMDAAERMHAVMKGVLKEAQISSEEATYRRLHNLLQCYDAMKPTFTDEECQRLGDLVKEEMSQLNCDYREQMTTVRGRTYVEHYVDGMPALYKSEVIEDYTPDFQLRLIVVAAEVIIDEANENGVIDLPDHRAHPSSSSETEED